MLPTLPPKQPKRTINTLQALRGIAALLVVSTHVETAYRENPVAGVPWVSHMGGLSGFGGVGVDIFFIISGFIMVYVGVRYFRGEGSITDFLARRVLRIYPLYWLVTLLLVTAATAKTLLSVVQGQPFAKALDFDLQWYRLLGAFTLFPTYNELGNVQPIVGVGWTLSYEVFFYLVFALALAIGFRWAPFVVVAVFVAIVFVPFPVGSSALGNFLKNPVLLEFPAGMLIGYAVVLSLRPPRWLILSCTLLGVVGFLPDLIWNFPYDYHYLYRGIPSALLIFGLIFWEIGVGLNVPPLLVKLGDASYATYLLHTLVISYVVLPVVKALPILQSIQVDVLGFFTFMIAAGAGWLLYDWLERPLQRALMNHYENAARVQRTVSSKPS
jgi:exopolysaccharide production protein ExoZ